MNQHIALSPSRLPIAPAIAKEFEIQPAQWRVLVEQIFPNAKSVEAVTMALAYCRARNLDIYKKPVHIVPMWSSSAGKMVETVWPGIAEIRTTAARTREYAGIDAVELGPMIERTFQGQTKDDNRWIDVEKTVRFPEWASVVVYRIVKGVRCPYHAKIFWEETYATIGRGDVPNEMWSRRARGQLDKCVEAAALRKAFPEELGNVYAAEEMEGQTIDLQAVGGNAAPSGPPPPPDEPEPEQGDDTGPPPPPVEEAEILEAIDQPDDADETPAEILANAETWFGNSKTVEHLEKAWEQFKPNLETLPEDDAATLQGLYDARLEQLEPNPLPAG